MQIVTFVQRTDQSSVSPPRRATSRVSNHPTEDKLVLSFTSSTEMTQIKRVAVIGAGSCGLATVKNCLEYGFEVVCFEKTDNTAGIWRFKSGECDGQGTVMKSTILNTSKELTGFSDFPPPKTASNFMRNTEVLEYLEAYSRHFNLEEHIRFRTEVCNVHRADDYQSTGNWIVTSKDLTTNKTQEEEFNAVLVVTGHHVYPNVPDMTGLNKFEGRILHSHDYKDSHSFENKRVLVVGLGNSGGDIMCELGRVTKQVFGSSRHGTWLTQRVSWGGYPRDVLIRTRYKKWLDRKLPKWLTMYLSESDMSYRLDHDRYGIKPAERAGQSPTLIADDMPLHLASGWVKLKPGISEVHQTSVTFEDGSNEDIDDIIFCTGYTFSFPFLEKGTLVPVDDNQMSLYKRIFPPDLSHSSLALIGFIDPLGPTVTMAELQARAVCHMWAHGTSLPSAAAMHRAINAEKAATMAWYKCSARRASLQIDYIPYMDELAEIVGARPNIDWRLWLKDTELALQLVFGPATSYQYRLTGPNPWPAARRTVVETFDRIHYAMNTRQRVQLSRKPHQVHFPTEFIRLVFAFNALFIIVSFIIMYLYTS
uniref:Flavin-containing monooxygenase n=1 Tax=Plectus sambesii TaxID=2011161 RepID=A0A914WPE3_9BILA